MYRIIILFLIIFQFLPACAQQTEQIRSIQGNIVLEDHTPGIGINVLLIKSVDSSLVKAAVTDDQGNFLFSDVMSGNYFIQTAFIGYATYTSNLIDARDNIVLETIQLNPSSNLTGEVNITAIKPMFERKHDRLIMDVTNSITSSGQNALEVLSKAPGVSVDGNEQLSMQGRQGVIVMVDGKPIPLGSGDLATYLKSIQSSEIEKIEFITNPSARYDAAGNAGIIDIKLKRDSRLGTNGSITINAGHGRFHKSGIAARFNYREKKYNVFLNYNYGNNKGLNDLYLLRRFYEQDSMTSAYDQHNYLSFPIQTHSLKTGIDYYLSSKTTLSAMGTLGLTLLDRLGENRSDVWNENSQVVSAFKTNSNSEELWHNGTANINFKHEFDNQGQVLTADADYGNYQTGSDQYFTTRYYNTQGQENNAPALMYGDFTGKLKLYSLKVDYNFAIKGGIKMEVGTKSSLVESDNNFLFFDQSLGHNELDTTKSNHFKYSEYISAGYFNANKQWDKWGVQLGIRGENTRAKGEQLTNGQNFKREYFQLFPSSVISFNANDNHQYTLSYSRRIDRPNYDQLNPFKFYLDPTTYTEGNPYLQPQLTNNIELTHTWKQKISTSLSYSISNDNITEVIYPDPKNSKITVQTNKNLTSFQFVGLGIFAQVQPASWWNLNTNGNVYFTQFKGDLAQTPLNRKQFTGEIGLTNTFILPHDLKVELSANAQAGQVYGYMTLEPRWSTSMGVSKLLWNKKGSVKLNFNDIFFTNQTRATSVYRNYHESFLVKRDTQYVMLTFTYNFGQGQSPASNRRAGGAEEEKRRVNSSNN